jgi:hypothetical protein
MVRSRGRWSNLVNGQQCFGQGEWYFKKALDQNGNIIFRDCWAVPSAEINNYTTFRMQYVPSDPGHYWFYTISYANSTNHCSNGCSIAGAKTTYDYIHYNEDDHNIFSGHNVYGHYWKYNEYQSLTSPYYFYFQPSACNGQPNNGCPHPANPTQMYWENTPQSGGQGGQLFSCDYETGTTCTYNG